MWNTWYLPNIFLCYIFFRSRWHIPIVLIWLVNFQNAQKILRIFLGGWFYHRKYRLRWELCNLTNQLPNCTKREEDGTITISYIISHFFFSNGEMQFSFDIFHYKMSFQKNFSVTYLKILLTFIFWFCNFYIRK
jgi:hypothetical protein